jgi:hypothetical protein
VDTRSVPKKELTACKKPSESKFWVSQHLPSGLKIVPLTVGAKVPTKQFPKQTSQVTSPKDLFCTLTQQHAKNNPGLLVSTLVCSLQ